ncbi:MAG TPA: type II secretion system F family protein [Planctomicrobium sp.]|nr:type II secretion system F family protein [Planctomicrobium sp.]
MTVFLFLFLVLVSAVTIGTLATILRPSWISALLGSLAGGLLPYFWLFLQRQRRLTRLRDQLPEAFDLMRRAVQSGQTMQMSMQIVSKECSLPINREFARCCEQYSLGLPQEAILKELARRNDIMEFRIFVVAMLVQRMSGGNPVELLENLAQRVRKRKRLRDRVQAFTSEGRMQAFVLCVLPVAAFIAIYFLDKNYAQVLLDRPWLLGSLVMAQVVGTVWIRQIVHFDY